MKLALLFTEAQLDEISTNIKYFYCFTEELYLCILYIIDRLQVLCQKYAYLKCICLVRFHCMTTMTNPSNVWLIYSKW